MKKIIANLTHLSLALIISLLFASCKIDFSNGIKGNGNEITQTRNADSNFTGIEVDSGINLEVQQANTKSITVVADENLQQYITTDLNNGVLKVTTTEDISDPESITVIIKMPIITNLQASSAAQITGTSILKCGNLALGTSSGSEINISIEAESLTSESSSGSSMILKGKVLKSDIRASSGSDVDAKQLLANDIIVKASSGSSVEVNPIVSLDANASSGSSIEYHNIPKTINRQSSSGASISKN